MSKLQFTETAEITITGPDLKPRRQSCKALPSRSPYIIVTAPSDRSEYISVTHAPSGLAIVHGVGGPRKARLLAAILAALPVDWTSEKAVVDGIRAMPEWYAWLKKVQYL